MNEPKIGDIATCEHADVTIHDEWYKSRLKWTDKTCRTCGAKWRQTGGKGEFIVKLVRHPQPALDAILQPPAQGQVENDGDIVFA